MILAEPRLESEEARAERARTWFNPEMVVAIFRTTFVIMVLVTLWLSGQVFDPFTPLYIAIVLAGLYNAALLLMYWRGFSFPGRRHFILILDIVFVTLWVGLSERLVGPVFFALYYALSVIAGSWFGARGAVLTALVSGGLYLAMLAATTQGDTAVLGEALRERIPFLILGGLLVGYIAEAQKRELERLEWTRRELDKMQQHRRLMQDFYDLVTPQILSSPVGLDVGVSFRAALRMGAGDYYDLLRLGDGRYGLCVADVAGKYGAEVLRVPVVKYALKAAAAVERRPARILERLNELVFDELQPDRFVTMFYAQVDPWSAEMLYVNAGHDPPLLLRANGTVEALESGGLVLGVLRDARYDEGRVVLAQGDAVVLYTDGAIEAFNVAGVEFGADRLRHTARTALAAASAAQAAHLILAEIEAFAQGGLRRDDITIMVARLAPRAEASAPVVTNGSRPIGGDDSTARS
jgi:sigma-B regulation protein RsbU (phosphoserine phosphatase)